MDQKALVAALNCTDSSACDIASVHGVCSSRLEVIYAADVLTMLWRAVDPWAEQKSKATPDRREC